jgi:hypothetical protein
MGGDADGDVAVVEMMQAPREEMLEEMKTLERQECAVGLLEDADRSREKEKVVWWCLWTLSLLAIGVCGIPSIGSS